MTMNNVMEAGASLKVSIYAFLLRWIDTKIEDEGIGIIYRGRYEKK